MGLVRSVLSGAGGVIRGKDADQAVGRLLDEVGRLDRRLADVERRLGELDRLSGLVERIEAHVGPLPEPEGTGFTPEMTLAQVRAAHPRADEVLARHHLGGCAACAVSEVETLAEGAAVHQLDLDALLADLRALPPN